MTVQKASLLKKKSLCQVFFFEIHWRFWKRSWEDSALSLSSLLSTWLRANKMAKWGLKIIVSDHIVMLNTTCLWKQPVLPEAENIIITDKRNSWGMSARPRIYLVKILDQPQQMPLFVFVFTRAALVFSFSKTERCLPVLVENLKLKELTGKTSLLSWTESEECRVVTQV